MPTTKALDAQTGALHGGANTVVEVTYADLTATGNTQTIALLNLLAKMGAWLVDFELPEAFVSSDATLISTSGTVGDGNSATNQLSATEMNAAGTEVFLKGGTATTVPIVYTADDTVDLFVTGTSAKALNTHTAGRALFYFRVFDALASAGRG